MNPLWFLSLSVVLLLGKVGAKFFDFKLQGQIYCENEQMYPDGMEVVLQDGEHWFDKRELTTTVTDIHGRFQLHKTLVGDTWKYKPSIHLKHTYENGEEANSRDVSQYLKLILESNRFVEVPQIRLKNCKYEKKGQNKITIKAPAPWEKIITVKGKINSTNTLYPGNGRIMNLKALNKETNKTYRVYSTNVTSEDGSFTLYGYKDWKQYTPVLSFRLLCNKEDTVIPLEHEKHMNSVAPVIPVHLSELRSYCSSLTSTPTAH